MGIGVSIFLLALGAILAFAVQFEVSGLDIEVIGIILMVVGAVGLAIAMALLSRDRGTPRGRGEVVEDRVTRERDVY
jgi:steroid 5-alpha reductase family enzyme